MPAISGAAEALAEPRTALRLFGKPMVEGERRLGVTVALDETIAAARAKAMRAMRQLQVVFS